MRDIDRVFSPQHLFADVLLAILRSEHYEACENLLALDLGRQQAKARVRAAADQHAVMAIVLEYQRGG